MPSEKQFLSKKNENNSFQLITAWTIMQNSNKVHIGR